MHLLTWLHTTFIARRGKKNFVHPHPNPPPSRGRGLKEGIVLKCFKIIILLTET
jgi:hypothetical protein